MVLRDTLQFSKTIDDALNALNQTDRTCSVYLGLGSSVNNTYRLIQYAETQLDVFDDTNWKNDANHPRKEGMIWKAYKDDKSCFAEHFLPQYGKITAELIWKKVAPRSETGDSQVIVMDFSNDNIYAMYPNPVTHEKGYNRPCIRIQLRDRFNEWN